MYGRLNKMPLPSYKVGEAPWEIGNARQASAVRQSFPVGQAPWEIQPSSQDSPGFIQSVAQGIAKPFLRLASTARSLPAIALAGTNKEVAEAASKEYDYGYFGKAKTLQKPVESIGVGLEAGTTISGFGGIAKSLAGKVAQFGVMGALTGTGEGLSEGRSGQEVAEQAALGGLFSLGTGGLALGASKAISKLATILPQRVVQGVLPKLKRGDTLEYALNNTKGLSTNQIIENSKKSLTQYGSQIDNILSHPDKAHISVSGSDVVQRTLEAFPNSEYTSSEIFGKLKTQLPSQAKTLTNLEKGSISLKSANILRSKLDEITYKVAIDSPEVKASKELAGEFGNILREAVKRLAPETVGVFENYSKEIALYKALNVAKDKLGFKPTLRDMFAIVAGFTHGGVDSAIKFLLIERGLSSPAVGLKVAKGLSKTGAISKPIRKIAPLVGIISAGNQRQK